MCFDYQSAGTGGNSGATHIENKVAAPGTVTGVGDNRQVGLLHEYRYGGNIEGIPGIIFTFTQGQHTPLTEDDVAVSLGGDIFGTGKEFFNTRPEMPLVQDRLVFPGHGSNQVLVIHILGANLEDIDVLRHHIDL